MKSRTPLGRAVQSSVDHGQMPPSHAEDHGGGTSLRDVILGGQDGLVNMLGIALGVVSAGGSTHVLIATGLAASVTESISMAPSRTLRSGLSATFTSRSAGAKKKKRLNPRLMSSDRRSAISMRRKDS